ncbi:cyclopropane-fatty-acyl-phospholipid synthase family protein [Rhodoferax sp.]|uniref:SAM-dependent methyltransferase n=1 Tax=Rhodoferax sp. TaxID=50421 RepID=UPI001ED283DA|nr:cyclopropane-fatty-acyl-phospholipid synthase family protein [Rhodoferax sp.]MBT9505143.1 class I SAM-dependent methyltransferase [Rhodoferax sp.]
MNTATAAPLSFPRNAPASARTALRLLQRLRHGALTLHLPDGSVQRFGEHGHPNLTASLMMRNWNVFAAALKSGDIGFAESYIAGDWSTPNLTELLKVFAANRREMDEVIFGTWAGRLLYRIKHLLNHNSRANSRKNIHAHYDLGNAFYQLWLDDTMNYSSAWFEGDRTQPMQDAQNAKVRRALRMARVKPGDRVLEIGCGWGALAEQTHTHFDASIVGVTLSHEQLAYANARMKRLGVAAGKVHPTDLRLQDYRDIQDPPFDAICSIEMVEAVGRAYWPQYFQTVARLLKPGGRACIQSIVIDDALFARYIQSTDFIQQYIFPGGCLPCPAEFRRQAAAAGLQVEDEFTFGADYAETLRRWRAAFVQRRAEVSALGFDERFMRIWEFYLCYCEAAFDAGDIDLVQFTLVKPPL